MRHFASYFPLKSGTRGLLITAIAFCYFAKGGSKDQLIPFGKDRFYFENNLTVMEFLRKDDGSISAMVAKTEERPDTFTRTDIRFDLPQAIHLSREVLEKYVGDYKFPNNFVLSIIKDGNKLYGKGAGPRQLRQEIVPYDTCRFFARNLDAQLLFNVDEHGVVTGLTKIQNGEQVAKKIE